MNAPPDSDPRQALLPTFVAEVRQRLADARSLLERLAAEDGPGNRQPLLEALARQAHTVKGSARIVGAGRIDEAATELERVLSTGAADGALDTASAGAARHQLDAIESELEALAGEVEAPAPPESVPGPPPACARGTVLYIEDSASNRRLVELIMARRPGAELVIAETAAAGLQLANERRPDLILLDLHLPDLPGEEVLGLLRSDPGTSGIPVVVVSADAIPARIEQLAAAGASAYLTKPFDLGCLLELVDSHLPAAG